MTREEMIIEFYEEGEVPFIIKLIDYIKGEIHEYRNNKRMDTSRRSTISDDNDSNTWFSINNKKFNNEEIK